MPDELAKLLATLSFHLNADNEFQSNKLSQCNYRCSKIYINNLIAGRHYSGVKYQQS